MNEPRIGCHDALIPHSLRAMPSMSACDFRPRLAKRVPAWFGLWISVENRCSEAGREARPYRKHGQKEDHGQQRGDFLSDPDKHLALQSLYDHIMFGFCSPSS
jgi:hypothetical protein